MPKSKEQRRDEAEKRRKRGLAMLTLNQMVDGVMLNGSLSVAQSGEIVDDSDKKPLNKDFKLLVQSPYSQKAFDLGEPVLKHHSSGLIGEFPHKILY